MDIKSIKMEAKLWIDLQNKIKKLIIKPNFAKLIN